MTSKLNLLWVDDTTFEGATEVFFDKLDANLFWSQPSEREIPLMQMVYSGYTIFFGSTVPIVGQNRRIRNRNSI